ncbi:MAG TPA: hypothetical protein VFE35_01500 [Candidatus Cybelea sp.]|jgi:hypothetical protein|nr:hypothetical protein [Candidatus Cybelea sp.]
MRFSRERSAKSGATSHPYGSAQREGRSVIYRITDARLRDVLRLTRAIVGDNAQRIATCVRIPER